MHGKTLPFFLPHGLESRYHRDVLAALQAKVINAHEYVWLSQLDVTDTGLRLDRLGLSNATALCPRLVGARVFSHADVDQRQVYLWSALDGLQRFVDRVALHAELNRLSGITGREGPDYELTLVQAPELFDGCMTEYVQQRALTLTLAAEWLERTPDLAGQLSETVASRLPALFKDRPQPPRHHWVQVHDSQADRVHSAPDLASVALQQFAAQPLPANCHYRWLDLEGNVLGDEAAQAMDKLMQESRDALAPAYAQALDSHWAGQEEAVARVLEEGFYQSLLQARHNEIITEAHFQWLRRAVQGSAPPGESARWLSLVEEVENKVVTVALQGCLWFVHPQWPDRFLYDGNGYLQRYFNEDALWEQLKGHALPPTVAQADHHKWRSLSAPRRVSGELGSRPFLACAKAIHARQQADLGHALRQAPTGEADTAVVKIDNALDLRPLLDLRLFNRGLCPRWATRPTATGMTPMVNAAVSKDARRLQLVKELTQRMEGLYRQQPGLEDCAHVLLDPALSVIDPHLDSTNVYAYIPAHTPTGSDTNKRIPVSQLLLDWVSQPTGRGPDVDRHVLDKDGVLLPSLPWPLLKTLLNDNAPRLLAHHRRMLEAQRGWRTRNAWVEPQKALVAILEQAVRLEYEVESEAPLLDGTLVQGLQQLLDFPLERQRQAKGPGHFLAHGLTLKFMNDRAAARLSYTVAIHAADDPTGKVLLWSVLYGLQQFNNLPALLHWVVGRFNDPQSKDAWLELLPPGDRGLLIANIKRNRNLLITCKPWRIEGHWLESTQSHELARQQLYADEARKLAVRCRFPGNLFRLMVDYASHSTALRYTMAGLDVALQVKHMENTLPHWLGKASSADMTRYVELLRRALAVQQPLNDYLFGLQDLHAFTRTKLQATLRTLIPVNTPDPDNILVTLTHYTPAPPVVGDTNATAAQTTRVNQTLTRCAVDQLTAVQTPVVSLTMADGSAVPDALHAEGIRAMIRELDIASQYQAYLATEFSPSSSFYTERRRRFSRLVSPQVVQIAFQQVLEGTLSRRACDYIEAVITMPDAMARLPVDGQAIAIRPLQMLASEGGTPDVAVGMHLIGPTNPSKGPLVLYTLNGTGPILREFEHQADLLAKVLASAPLQEEIIGRLPADVRTRYRHGGMRHPHFPELGNSIFDVPPVKPLAVTFDSPVEQGNALHYLFDDTVALMQRLALENTVTTSEADRRAFVQLLTLGTELGALFLPKALSSLVNLWQSKDWLASSLHAAFNHRWGEALARFTAGLFLLLGERNAAATREEGQPTASRWRSAPVYSWRTDGWDTELSARLSSFEVPGLELRAMTKDPALHLFLKDQRCFAILQGRVYEVEPFKDAWRIIDGQRKGPRIRWSNERQWHAIGGDSLRGGGNTAREFEEELIESDLRGVLEVQARGMTQIRAMDTLYANMIEAAHQQARSYLTNALENLNAKQQWLPLPVQTEALLKGFFGIKASSTQLLHKLRVQFEQIITELLDPSLAPATSDRFVIGRNGPGYSQTVALTFPSDSHHDIYLSEVFFRVDADLLKQVDPAKGFNLYAHYQAVNLIHELSHIANKTNDIAYLGAFRPFDDVYRNSSPADQAVINALILPRTYLSHRTPRQDLFRVMDRVTLAERDLGPEEGNALKRVLQLSGAKTLDAARDLFLLDETVRTAIILANADSVALLVSLLGRERFEAPAG